jgi:hypothetical protein
MMHGTMNHDARNHESKKNHYENADLRSNYNKNRNITMWLTEKYVCSAQQHLHCAVPLFCALFTIFNTLFFFPPNLNRHTKPNLAFPTAVPAHLQRSAFTLTQLNYSILKHSVDSLALLPSTTENNTISHTICKNKLNTYTTSIQEVKFPSEP